MEEFQKEDIYQVEMIKTICINTMLEVRLTTKRQLKIGEELKKTWDRKGSKTKTSKIILEN